MWKRADPAWMDDEKATVTLREVRASVEFERRLAEPKAAKAKPEKRGRRGAELVMGGEA